MATRRSAGRSLCVAIAAGMVVSACGTSSASPSGSLASTEAAMSGTASLEPSMSLPPTTSPSGPSASAAVMVDLGVVGITPRGSRVTVHSFGRSDRTLEPPVGSTWLEADVEWCLPPTITSDVTVGQVRFELALELSDHTTISPDADSDSPDEVFASDGTFSANECVRGALVFAVPTGATPEYLLLVGNLGGMRWALA